jgi:flagellar protein FliO/FliZ
MTVRRFLVATAVAVLFGAQTSVAWADGSVAYDGGARSPVQFVTVADVHRDAGHVRAHASKHASKRETGIFSAENKPLNLGASTAKKGSSSASGGASILRTIAGLLLVVGLIYAVAWVLRRVKRSREDQASGRGLQSVATLPLGSGRSLHLVRAGSDVILVGSSEHGVAPIQRYTEEEALANGVLSDAGQEAALRDVATTFMPDGTPSADSGGGQWRPFDGARPSAGASVIDALRRLTVRS